MKGITSVTVGSTFFTVLRLVQYMASMSSSIFSGNWKMSWSDLDYELINRISVDGYPEEQWRSFVDLNNMNAWVAKCPPCVIFDDSDRLYRLGDLLVKQDIVKEYFAHLGLMVDTYVPRPQTVNKLIYRSTIRSVDILNSMSDPDRKVVLLYFNYIGVV